MTAHPFPSPQVCCDRDFNDLSEYKAFTNRMAELADEDTSELIRVNQAKSKDTAALLSKLEVCTKISVSIFLLQYYE